VNGRTKAKSSRPVQEVPRLALTIEEAAASIGCGRSFFYEAVLPSLRIIRAGRRRLVPVAELARWVEENASAPLTEDLRWAE